MWLGLLHSLWDLTLSVMIWRCWALPHIHNTFHREFTLVANTTCAVTRHRCIKVVEWLAQLMPLLGTEHKIVITTCSCPAALLGYKGLKARCFTSEKMYSRLCWYLLCLFSLLRLSSCYCGTLELFLFSTTVFLIKGTEKTGIVRCSFKEHTDTFGLSQFVVLDLSKNFFKTCSCWSVFFTELKDLSLFCWCRS